MNHPALPPKREALAAESDQVCSRLPLNRDAFLARWRAEGERLSRIGALVDPSKLLAEVLQDAETLFRIEEHDLLTLTQAAAESGYTADHLGRLVRNGVLQNFGRPNAPRVRRGDLPRKLNALPGGHANPDLLGASRRQVAKAITTSGSRR